MEEDIGFRHSEDREGMSFLLPWEEVQPQAVKGPGIDDRICIVMDGVYPSIGCPHSTAGLLFLYLLS